MRQLSPISTVLLELVMFILVHGPWLLLQELRNIFVQISIVHQELHAPLALLVE